MKYDHIVNYAGVYYMAGEDIPEDKVTGREEPLPFSDVEIEMETSPHKYTYDELEQISVRKIKRMAEEAGIEITKVIKEEVIQEFLQKQK